jgi:hypothetical protein
MVWLIKPRFSSGGQGATHGAAPIDLSDSDSAIEEHPVEGLHPVYVTTPV